MKRLILGMVSLAATVGVLAQGNILFGNKNTNPAVDAAIIDVDGTTPVGAGAVKATLWIGETEASLAPAMDANTGAIIEALTVSTKGYFAGVSHVVKDIAAGVPVFAQVDVMSTDGMKIGKSNIIPITLTAPPSTPAAMVGLEAIHLTMIPEPSVLSLGVLGLAGLMIRRRS